MSAVAAKKNGSLIVTEGNSVLPVAGTGSTGGSGSTSWRGLYSTLNNYEIGDAVYTDPATDTRFLWVAEIANGPAKPAGVQQPTWPEPVTVYWRCYARGPQCPDG